jgi:hypothetical protein
VRGGEDGETLRSVSRDQGKVIGWIRLGYRATIPHGVHDLVLEGHDLGLWKENKVKEI